MWSLERKILFGACALALSACHAKGAQPSEGSAPPESSEGSDVGKPADCTTPECGNPPAATGNCAVTLCAPHTYCDDASGEAKCLPLPSCAAHSCLEGQHCELVEVQCVRAPCPPQPACISHENK
jgi:hypothetical protein